MHVLSTSMQVSHCSFQLRTHACVHAAIVNGGGGREPTRSAPASGRGTATSGGPGSASGGVLLQNRVDDVDAALTQPGPAVAQQESSWQASWQTERAEREGAVLKAPAPRCGQPPWRCRAGDCMEGAFGVHSVAMHQSNASAARAAACNVVAASASARAPRALGLSSRDTTTIQSPLSERKASHRCLAPEDGPGPKAPAACWPLGSSATTSERTAIVRPPALGTMPPTRCATAPLCNAPRCNMRTEPQTRLATGGAATQRRRSAPVVAGSAAGLPPPSPFASSRSGARTQRGAASPEQREVTWSLEDAGADMTINPDREAGRRCAGGVPLVCLHIRQHPTNSTQQTRRSSPPALPDHPPAPRRRFWQAHARPQQLFSPPLGLPSLHRPLLAPPGRHIPVAHRAAALCPPELRRRHRRRDLRLRNAAAGAWRWRLGWAASLLGPATTTRHGNAFRLHRLCRRRSPGCAACLACLPACLLPLPRLLPPPVLRGVALQRSPPSFRSAPPPQDGALPAYFPSFVLPSLPFDFTAFALSLLLVFR